MIVNKINNFLRSITEVDALEKNSVHLTVTHKIKGRMQVRANTIVYIVNRNSKFNRF
jgi:hypothetical protein